MIADLRDYFVKTILRKGTPVCIRAIRPDGKERLAGHFARLSSESRYYRFFGFRLKSEQGRKVLKQKGVRVMAAAIPAVETAA